MEKSYLHILMSIIGHDGFHSWLLASQKLSILLKNNRENYYHSLQNPLQAGYKGHGCSIYRTTIFKYIGVYFQIGVYLFGENIPSARARYTVAILK